MDILEKLKPIKHLALDMDGTIYKGSTLFDFTLDFLSRMDSLKIGYTFLTNNSSKSIKDYLASLKKMGINAAKHQMYSSTLATIDYLNNQLPQAKKLYILGTESLSQEFFESGFSIVKDSEEPDAVIVGFDKELTYPKLCKAAYWIEFGKPFIATHPDLICPTDEPTVLVDCGAICACLEKSTGCSPTVVLGKPDPCMLTGILNRHNLAPQELGMVGDRLYTDIAMGHNSGALGILVLSGEATLEDVDTCPKPPDVIVKNIGELGDLLEKVNR